MWITSEPLFMFQWLGRFYRNVAPPKKQVELLFLGTPTNSHSH